MRPLSRLAHICAALGFCTLFFSAGIANASIVPNFQQRYLSTSVELSDEGFDSGSDFDDIDSFDPFNSAITALASVGTGSGYADAMQESTMNAIEIHATGSAAIGIQFNVPGNGSAFAESHFDYIFSVDQAGWYAFDAAAETGGVGSFSSEAYVELKNGGGTIQTLLISGIDTDDVPTTNVFLDVGTYAIFARSTVEIAVNGFAGTTNASSEFEVNLVYVIPEPTTLIMLITAVPLLLRRRR